MLDDQEILDEFRVEAAEHLADIETELLTIESDGDEFDVDLVNKVFRGVHSIKGAAGFIGLNKINTLAHCLENLLNLMREKQLIPTPAHIEEMLQSADKLRLMINHVASSNETDIRDHVDALTAIAEGTKHEGTQPADNVNETETEPTPSLPPDGAQVAAPPRAVETPTVESKECSRQPEQVPLEATAQADSNSGSSEKQNDLQVIYDGQTRAHKRVAESSIRVPVDAIDHLMNLAGELVLSRNQLLQAMGSQEGAIDGVVARINQVTSELQDAIMQTRMQPIGTVFNRFTRVMRDLGNSLGKKCQIEIVGKEVELDKTIVEAIGDPLTHLVRNAVDHGIESESDRIAAGKPAIGSVHLCALHQSGKVRIEIADDGGGIDADNIRKKAVEKGLLTSEDAAALADRDAIRFIFQPGFSTAERLSDVSGRGVGMDVVKTNIEKLGGSVEVDSVLGTGTTISITLPLTLAIIPSLIVQSNGDRFAIPQVNIVELVRVRSDEHSDRLGRVGEADVLRLRGELLPLVALNQTLGSNSDSNRETSESLESFSHGAVNIVVVDTGQFRYGLVVEQLFDSEEIVVKPLGQHLSVCPCLSGATILGDGRVALILDVGGIAQFEKLRIVSVENVNSGPPGVDEEELDETHDVLVFRNHSAERFAISMGIVARIERIRTDQIDSVGGKNLLQYRGVSLPLICLEDHTSAKPRLESRHLFVIVFDVLGREVGLIAPTLEDIREVSGPVDTATLKEIGISGAMVIDDAATRIVDLFELAQCAEPAWFEHRTRLPNDVGADERSISETTILVAEDSGFFRKQVKKYLEESGFRVVEAEDGQMAWDLLLQGEDVHGVVTDVQMPNMTGFELSRHIKDHPELKTLPVIALTSLAGDEDIRKGEDAGVDDYQVKMDRERLISSVIRLTCNPRSRDSVFAATADDGLPNHSSETRL